MNIDALQCMDSSSIYLIPINHQLDTTVPPVYYPDVYLQLNMFRVSSHPSSGAQLQ